MKVEKQKKYVKVIKTFVLPEDSGDGVFWGNHEFSNIDECFKKWRLNSASRKVPAVEVEVIKIKSPARYKHMLRDFEKEADKFLTQSQVMSIIKKYPEELVSSGYLNLFFIKHNNFQGVVGFNVAIKSPAVDPLDSGFKFRPEHDCVVFMKK